MAGAAASVISEAARSTVVPLAALPALRAVSWTAMRWPRAALKTMRCKFLFMVNSLSLTG
jgi:hypothetical protein